MNLGSRGGAGGGSKVSKKGGGSGRGAKESGRRGLSAVGGGRRHPSVVGQKALHQWWRKEHRRGRQRGALGAICYRRRRKKRFVSGI
jgi:hypothetical protein